MIDGVGMRARQVVQHGAGVRGTILTDDRRPQAVEDATDEFDAISLDRVVARTADDDETSLVERLADLSTLIAGAGDDVPEPAALDLVEEDDEEDVETSMSNGVTAAAIADSDLAAVSLDDPVRMYLREIGRVPLLSAAREV